MKKNENPYSILVPYLPMDSFELLRARIIPEGDPRAGADSPPPHSLSGWSSSSRWPKRSRLVSR
jgi:hypothetical protein